MLRGLAILALVAALTGCEDDRTPVPATAARPDPPATIAEAEWKAVVEDWYDNGVFDEPHTCEAVRETIERVPRRDYAPAIDDVEAYADLVCGDS